MKNLITSVASIMLLLSLLIQFSYNQLFFNRIMFVERQADVLKSVVKENGYLQGEDIKKVQNRISNILDCDKKDIEIHGNKIPANKGEIIDYSIEVPVNEFVISFFQVGNRDKDRIKKYKCERFVMSEYSGGKDEKFDYNNR